MSKSSRARRHAQYASHPSDLKTVGLQLGVAAVLEGSVQKAGEAVHINLQLIDTQSDGHLWAESYDRDFKDIFGVERDVAEKVAGALKATLIPGGSRACCQRADTKRGSL